VREPSSVVDEGLNGRDSAGWVEYDYRHVAQQPILFLSILPIEETLMTDRNDELLNKQIAKLGAIGGAVGGLRGAASGYLGAGLAARFLPTETCSASIEIDASAESTLRAAFEVLQSSGRLIDQPSDDCASPTLSATIGSGFLNMNPAVVCVSVEPVSPTACRATVTGAAKEGWIKQHTAEKAVNRVKAALLTACTHR
jgi:hypothetical protein